jgi:hypothetical protein
MTAAVSKMYLPKFATASGWSQCWQPDSDNLYAKGKHISDILNGFHADADSSYGHIRLRSEAFTTPEISFAMHVSAHGLD